MCRRFNRRGGLSIALWAACWMLSACKNGRELGPCASVHCPIGLECQDGKCLPVVRHDAAVSGEPDAQLATNEIPDGTLPAVDAGTKPVLVDAGAMQPEAAVPDAAQPDAAPVYRMQGAALGLPDSRPSGLRMIEQRLGRPRSSCAAVSGSQLCIHGGIGP